MELNSAFNNSTEFKLRHIEEVPEQYRVIFAGYPYFNVVQSEVFDHILNTDKSVIVSAPTGSGKTAIFELAIVKLLIDNENVTGQDFKIIYISPMKALCEERLADWHVKFSNFGLSCISVTGDSDYFDYSALNNYNLIITTPEKWDSITRKWRENVKLVEVIKLFLIDEVHLLHEDNRGSTLEVIVSRMKTINNKMELIDKIRYVAVSATVPNIEDVAEWIGGKTNTWHHKIAEDMRPVPLKKLIFGYNFDSQNKTWFKFDLSLNYKLHNLLLQYSDGKPTLIFCSTRKSVEMTARHIKQNLTINLNPSQKEKLLQASKLIQDSNAKQTLIHGVGYHHAGLLPETKRAIEDLFRNCDLPILVTTSTLAMGVNLPAHLVIVKSTKCYTSRGYEDYPETVIMQMIGRAGRPQFDTSATAIIMTTADDKRRFENMVGGGQNVESNLHKHLDEHLNAEIVLGTIKDLGVAKHWLSTTFLYIRARKNPRYYGINPALTLDEIDKKLLDMCQIQINKLARAGMLTLDQNITITPTDVGKIMAKYCVAFETMKLFTRVNGSEGLQQILALISRSNEFSELYLRTNDKKCLNMLNKNKNNTTIRFPLNGRIKTLDMKINCIIQAVFSNLNIWDQSILADSQKIMRNGERVINCFIEYLTTRQKCFSALLHGHILSKCFKAKLWENSPFVSKQLNGIGSVFSNLLVNAGKKTFNDILQTNPRELEIILKKKSPFGSKIQDEVKHIPKYTMTLELHDKKSIKLTITLMNLDSIDEYVTGNDLSLMTLLIGDEDNNILLYEQYSHTYMMDHPTIMKFVELENLEADEISAYFISEQWVGIDCEYKLTLESKTKNGEKVKDKESPANKQSLLNMYMKVTKDINKPQKEIKRSKSPKTNCKKKKVESKSLQRTITEVFGRTIGNEKITDNDEKIIVHQNIILKNSEEKSKIDESSDFFDSKIDDYLNKIEELTGMDEKKPKYENNNNNNNININDEDLYNLDFSDEDFSSPIPDTSVSEKLSTNTTDKTVEEKNTLNLHTNSQSKQKTDATKLLINCPEENDKTILNILQKYGISYSNPKQLTPKTEEKKVCPAMDFENSLYEEKENHRRLCEYYQFTPSKRLSHNNDSVSTQRCEKKSLPLQPRFDEYGESGIQRNIAPKLRQSDINFDVEEKATKSISWRSPLVSNSQTRHSPVTQQSNFSMNPKNELVNLPPLGVGQNYHMTTGLPPKGKKPCVKFPLCDREFTDDNFNTSTNSLNTTEDFSDISNLCSASFLEQIGIQKQKHIQTTPTRVGDYYKKTVTQNKERNFERKDNVMKYNSTSENSNILARSSQYSSYTIPSTIGDYREEGEQTSNPIPPATDYSNEHMGPTFTSTTPLTRTNQKENKPETYASKYFLDNRFTNHQSNQQTNVPQYQKQDTTPTRVAGHYNQQPVTTSDRNFEWEDNAVGFNPNYEPNPNMSVRATPQFNYNIPFKPDYRQVEDEQMSNSTASTTHHYSDENYPETRTSKYFLPNRQEIPQNIQYYPPNQQMVLPPQMPIGYLPPMPQYNNYPYMNYTPTMQPYSSPIPYPTPYNTCFPQYQVPFTSMHEPNRQEWIHPQPMVYPNQGHNVTNEPRMVYGNQELNHVPNDMQSSYFAQRRNELNMNNSNRFYK